jgi:hypothetical protein
VVKPRPTTNTESSSITKRPGKILRTRATMKSRLSCLVRRLAVTRNPLVRKKTSTAIEPSVMPRV